MAIAGIKRAIALHKFAAGRCSRLPQDVAATFGELALAPIQDGGGIMTQFKPRRRWPRCILAI